MEKNWPTIKMGIWYRLKRLLFLTILIPALSLCLFSVAHAGSSISKKNSLDLIDNVFPITVDEGNNTNVGQQNIIIKGKVTDASNGESLPGVNIAIAGTGIGTTSNMEGEYSLNVPDENATIVFSFVGYTVENIIVGDKRIINVELKQNITELGETVVIGYQEVHKKRVTASIVSIASETLSEIPAASISTLLSGKAAGVQNLVRTGAPGMRAGGMVIRGNTHVSSDLDVVNGLSSPLYVVDGIPMSLEDLAGYDVTNTDYLASLNPADIESIDILKDASAAAIYGSRGANGVIIIKTKKGHAGEPEFRLNAYYGVSVRPDLYKVYTGAADRRFKLALIEQSIPDYTEWGPYSEARARVMPLELTDSLNPAFNNNYDYQGMFYRRGIVNNYDFNVTGGSNVTNYRIGLGYYDEKGIVTANGFKRYTFNANIRNRFSKKVMNDLTVRGSFMDRETGLDETDPNKTFPIDPIDLPASYLYKSQEELDALVGKLNKVYNTNRVLETRLSNLLQIDLIEGLRLNSQIGLSYTTSKKNFFGPSTIHENNQSSAAASQSLSYAASVETFATYDKKMFENHRLSLLAGHSITHNQNEILHLTGDNGSSDGIKTIVGYKKENIFGFSDVRSNNMISYWLRAGYTIKERYMFDINYRREASSRFGKDKRWGNFPALSAGWEISDEPFWKPVSKVVTYAKFRASWGINGNQYADDYLRFNEYTTKGLNLWSNQMDIKSYGGTTAITPDFNKIANNNLGWEETTQWNLGVDLTAFTNRLYVTFDAYHKYTDGLVFDINFPSYSGYSSAKANLIDIVNQGWELSFDAHLLPRDNDFQCELLLNFSHNENYIAKLPYDGRDYLNKNLNYAYVRGFSLNVPWMYEYLGAIQNLDELPVNPFTGERLKNRYSAKYSDGLYFPGMSLMRDVDGNYLFESLGDDDFAFLTGKTSNPKIHGGLGTVIRYKKWSLRANTSFAFGHWIFNRTMYERLFKYTYTPNDWPWVPKASYELPDDFWQQPGDNTKYPEFTVSLWDVGTGGNFEKSSLFLEKGDYFKIEDITVSYTLDPKTIKKLKIGDIRLYATASNVYQWQKSSVPDATMVDARGYDYGNGYPLSRKFIFGVNVKF